MAMDFITGPTTTVTTPPTPDSDTDTPPHPPPSKRAHHNLNPQHQHVTYKECLKNHAATIGGHALDGCCEFMPGPTANPLNPTSLTCAACGCHRNFHRRDPDDPTPLHHLIPPSTGARKAHSPPSASHLLLSLSGHTHSPSAPSDHEILQNNPTSGNGVPGHGPIIQSYYNNNNGSSSSSKKRFRTKFSQEQKEKMHEFSETIGWKLKKGEERLVEEFCKEIGVDRNVFKVWMHNNKHSSSTSGSSSQRREKNGINCGTTTTTTTDDIITMTGATTTTSNSNSNGHNHNHNNLNVGLNNCGGVLATALDFNFANAGAQQTKAQ